jgi:hypothetical protein
MLTFPEIIAIYKETGIYNHVIECLMMDDMFEVAWAVAELRKANLVSKDAVLLYIACGVM